MGIDVGILYVFAEAFVWGFAAAIAIGVGLAIGWGGHTYVEENVGRWMRRTSSENRSPRGSTQTDGGGPDSADD